MNKPRKQSKRKVLVAETAAQAPAPAVAKKQKSPATSAVIVVLKSIFIFLGAQVLGSFIVSMVGVGTGSTSKEIVNAINENDFVRFLLIFCIEAITVWLIYLFLKREKQTFKDIGFTKKMTKDYIKVAALGYLFYFALFIAVISIVGALGLINTNQAQQIGFDKAQGINLIFAFLSLVVLPPLAEELLFRGYLFQKLQNHTTIIVATAVTSVLFSIAHLEFGSGNSLNWAAALDTFILSAVLCYVTVRTKSLWPAIIIHAVKNGVAFVALFILT